MSAIEIPDKVEVVSVLEREETLRLKKLEATIRDGLKTFTEVGIALLEIRDRRLYRATHLTFEAYCKSQWGITKTHANRLIGASRVVENIKEVGPIPMNEVAVRSMTGLKPEQQREVWTKVTTRFDDPKAITANAVTRVVNEVVGDDRRRSNTSGRVRKPSDKVKRSDVLAAIEEWAGKTKHIAPRAVSALRILIEQL